MVTNVLDEAIAASAENAFYNLTYEGIYKKLLVFVDNPLVDKRNFVSPDIWTNESLLIQNNYLKNSIGKLIIDIQKNNKDLCSVTWKQLEEIIGEIFRSQGMQVILNKDVPQGGRDIIGRFHNGFEFVNVAIEVKHKPYIDKPVLSSFIHQNRMFPLLYLITSGKFSAGVINETKSFENRLRVKLYDGTSVKSLLNMYVSK